ncbi:hypothetical protein CRP804_gp42 [Roseobacter phage CRP-804]|uniref:Uncharacterized protein n=1 Tax=Roseobacter phage CRP-804 TaxID=3072850 RepID=A0AAX3ZXZ9_9CAUD|nr:hypothetical protein CRP804_gp42 [Roseobacter phage CRP-804]
MTLVSGCATVVSEDAICDGTERLRDDHTDALLADGGDLSVTTGAALIDALDRACGT